MTEIFNILNRFTGAVQFSAEIECKPDELPSIKLGLAVRVAVEAGADLARANLPGANLAGAYLAGANLTGAYLAGANLAGANLTGAYLARANLARANLAGAYLADAKNADIAIARTRILSEGALIGWKKLKNGTIARLRIPEEAARSHAWGRKCRAEFVDVIEGEGVSIHDGVTKYAPGLRVTCDKWEPDWQRECAGGIHFYITREEAEAHQ